MPAPNSQPFPSKVAIARHYGCSPRRIYDWAANPLWPPTPTPATVDAFLRSIGSPFAPAPPVSPEPFVFQAVAPAKPTALDLENAEDVLQAVLHRLLTGADDDLRQHVQARLPRIVASIFLFCSPRPTWAAIKKLAEEIEGIE